MNRTIDNTTVTPDPTVFTRLLLAAQPRISTYIRSLVYDRIDAEDILQEVAATGWRKFTEYDPSRPFELWMFGLARNQVRYYFQKRKRDILRFSAETTRALEQAAAESAQDSAPYHDALEHCLQHLEDMDRELIRRRYEPEATNRSVARALSVSESKVSRALNRIHVMLLLCMKRHLRERSSPCGTSG